MISWDDYVASNKDTRKVKKIMIQGCKDSDFMKIILQTELIDKVDDNGIVKDAIWKLKTPGLPHRWVRLWNGWNSLERLLTKYSFFDAHGCVYNLNPPKIVTANASNCSTKMNVNITPTSLNKRNIYVHTCSREYRYRQFIPCHVPLKEVGIAQLSDRSGICWWGSMWFALCYSPDCMNVLLHYIQKSRHVYLKKYLNNVLKTQKCSEALRKLLYETFGIGDNPKQEPELDGQNGYAQFSLLCSKLNIPMVTLMAPWMKDASSNIRSPVGEMVSPPRKPSPNEPAFLGIRTYRSVHVPKFEIKYGGRIWKLRSAMIGSEFCGHQIAISSCCGSQGKWAVYDSDGVKECIGPVAWDISETGDDGEMRWWSVLDKVMPIINKTNSSKYCDMNPHNRHPLESVNRAYMAELGNSGVKENDLQNTHFNQVNLDWIYTSV